MTKYTTFSFSLVFPVTILVKKTFNFCNKEDHFTYRLVMQELCVHKKFICRLQRCETYRLLAQFQRESSYLFQLLASKLSCNYIKNELSRQNYLKLTFIFWLVIFQGHDQSICEIQVSRRSLKGADWMSLIHNLFPPTDKNDLVVRVSSDSQPVFLK